MEDYRDKILTVSFGHKADSLIPVQIKQGEVDSSGITVYVEDVKLNNCSSVVNYEYHDGSIETYQAIVKDSTITLPIISKFIGDGVVKLELVVFNALGEVYKSATYKYRVHKSLGYVEVTDSDQQLIASIVLAEQERVNNENVRIENENTRVSNEDTRVSEETIRVINEDERVTKETIRVSNEDIRIVNEDIRIVNEDTRASEETIRVNNEVIRVSNEDTRVSNEDTRKSSETSRVNAEASRVENEDARKSSETTRINNENARVSEEASRVARFENMTASQQQSTEVVDARMSADGTVHTNLKTRLEADFDNLSSFIPKNLSFNGHETITADNTVSGNVNNGVVSGETLVSPLSSLTKHIQVDGAIEVGTRGKFRIFHSNHIWSGGGFRCGSLIKPSTDYTLRMKFKNTTDRNIEPFHHNAFSFVSPKVAPNANFDVIYKRRTNASLSSTDFLFTTLVSSATVDSTGNPSASWVDYEFYILEGDHTDKPLEFFEGLKSAEISEVETHGVNLIDESQCTSDYIFEDGAIVEQGGGGIWYDVLQFEKPITGTMHIWNRTATFSHNFRLVNEDGSVSGQYGYTKNYIAAEATNAVKLQSYTKGTKGHRFNVFITDTSSKEYIPYESTKLTTDSPIVLRSLPNGLADTLDLETGELTRRCGEVVLDGSEPWIKITAKDDYAVGEINIGATSSDGSGSNVRSDKFKSGSVWGASSTFTEERIMSPTPNVWSDLRLSISQSKLTTINIAGFKAWLQANPTTVVYQLATPTTEIIDLDGYLKSHDYQTTITAPSVIPAKLSFDIPVNLKHWLEANSVSMTMLANDASTQQVLIEHLNSSQETQDAEIIDNYEATAMLYEQMNNMPSTLELSSELSPMATIYKKLIESGKRTLESIPEAIRKELE